MYCRQHLEQLAQITEITNSAATDNCFREEVARFKELIAAKCEGLRVVQVIACVLSCGCAFLRVRVRTRARVRVRACVQVCVVVRACMCASATIRADVPPY